MVNFRVIPNLSHAEVFVSRIVRFETNSKLSESVQCCVVDLHLHSVQDPGDNVLGTARCGIPIYIPTLS